MDIVLLRRVGNQRIWVVHWVLLNQDSENNSNDGKLWLLGAKIIILIHGKMTAKQRAKAKENSTIRVEKVVEALRWLSENHVDGEQFDIDKWKEKYDKKQIRVRTCFGCNEE